jgi:uncharacterized cupredoxin-like copper-binding protein
MRLRRFLLTVALGLVAACSGSGTSAPPSSAPSGDGSGTRIEVRLVDSFRIEPGDFQVPAGEPVTFVVTNGGALEHEFFVGDEAAQADHDAEMLSSGGVLHDGATGIGVKPGETKELTLTLEAGSTFAGCHVPGHYAGGMKTTITASE